MSAAWRKAFAASVLSSLTAAGALAQQAPAPTVTYESYCDKTRMEKQELLKTMTEEQKAMIWRTQIERWRDANATTLTADQRTLLADFHAIIPLAVKRPRTPEGDAKLNALEARPSGAFNRDQMRAMDNYGPCLPKVK
jgi:hypothetical protein